MGHDHLVHRERSVKERGRVALSAESRKGEHSLFKSNRSLKVLASLLLMAVVITFAPIGVFSNEAEAANRFANRYSVVRTARKYMGRPYIFGANGPRSFDCSGFTRYVYRLHGYYIPRTAAAQSRVGKFVSSGNWRYGDLIFFRNTYKRGISHVGIYAGNNRIIHAWPRSGVTVHNFRTYSYLRTRYAGARRILK